MAASLAALGLVVLGALARCLISSLLGSTRTLFLLLLPGVLVGAVTGGLLSGLTAAILASVLGSLLLAYDGAPSIENWVETLLFATLCVLITCGGEWLLRVRRRTAAMAQRILERETHLRSILDAVPDAIIILDEQGIVQSFSHAAKTLLRWSMIEAIGANIAAIVPELGAPPALDRQCFASIARRGDGTTVPVDLSIGRLSSGGRPFVIVFLRDLTEREEADRRMRQLQAEVTHISRLSAMGEMAATLAHELNQPLTAITNFLNGGRRLLLKGSGQNELVQEAIDKAAAQALRAGQIIRSLRELGRSFGHNGGGGCFCTAGRLGRGFRQSGGCSGLAGFSGCCGLGHFFYFGRFTWCGALAGLARGGSGCFHFKNFFYHFHFCTWRALFGGGYSSGAGGGTFTGNCLATFFGFTHSSIPFSSSLKISRRENILFKKQKQTCSWHIPQYQQSAPISPST